MDCQVLIYIYEVYKTLIVRDIIKRYKIKNKELLDNLNDFLMDNISNITTARNITKELNSNGTEINHKTIGSYIKYFSVQNNTIKQGICLKSTF